MTTQELIRGYEEIIESLHTLADHPIASVNAAARIQIDRCERSIRELKANLLEA